MRAQLAIKRLIDILVSVFLLVLLGPVLLLVALLIRWDSPGPALFRQLRLGKERIPFACYKFRTMYMDVPDVRNPDGSTFNADDDPRVTRIGRLLRRTSLDEIPQLINVLKGDMSLVGPRPDVADALSLYRGEDWRRLTVKPGITGWAAIHGRNSLPLDRRRALDLEYVDNFTLLLDLRILMRTIPTVLLAEGLFVPKKTEERNAHGRH